MDANTVISVIGSLGFPIVACVGMFYLYDRTLKEFTSTLNDIAAQIKELRADIKEFMKEGKDA